MFLLTILAASFLLPVKDISLEQKGNAIEPVARPWIAAASKDLSGEYAMKGWDPYLNSNYSGFATITKDKNGVYQGIWSLGNRNFIGTGMMCCEDIITFIFLSNENFICVGVYKMVANTLKGNWVLLNNSKVSVEELLKK